ncbi:MAG: SHOCT domain-containing protein [Candidatus Nanopelagicales bacterium]
MNTMIIVSILVPIAVTVAILFIVRTSLSGGSKKKMAQAQELMTTGNKARAKIVRIDPTGMVVNNINIQCWVTFQLEPLAGGAPFNAKKKILINQTQMPRVGDVWPAWYSPTDPTLFAVGMPDGASAEQIPLFREFGIPHPLDQPAPAAPQDDDPVGDLARLVKMKDDGMLTDEEFKAAKARLLET